MNIEQIKNEALRQMTSYFGTDYKRINHAEKVLYYAEKLIDKYNSDKLVVILTSIFHDIGIKESERKYNSSAAKYQHIEGPPVARQFLKKMKIDEKIIDEICDIIGHHHTPRKNETSNYKTLYEADLIVNLQDKNLHQEEITKIIEKLFP